MRHNRGLRRAHVCFIQPRTSRLLVRVILPPAAWLDMPILSDNNMFRLYNRTSKKVDEAQNRKLALVFTIQNLKIDGIMEKGQVSFILV